MDWNADHIIFFVFLVLNIIVGLKASKGIKNIKQYAIGDGNISTSILTYTIVATYVGGGFFMFNIVENYQHGLFFALTSIAEILTFLIIGWYFAPRLKQFIGKVSIAEAMGELYKEKVQLITAICGFIGVIGFITLQLKVAGIVFVHVFNVDQFYGCLVAGLIVALYSSIGGIKSVTFTDMIQVLTFGSIIPMIAYEIFIGLGSIKPVIEVIQTNPNFNLSKVLNPADLKFWNYLSIFVIFLIPNFDPAIFQRIAMFKSVSEMRKSFYTVFFICLFLLASMFWLSLVILAKDPSLPADKIIKVGVFDVLPVGMKGLLLIGVFSIVMSTMDSYINSSSVLITHDFCKALKIELKNELLFARFISFVLGIVPVFLTLKETNLLKFSIFCISFYTPVVVVPFIMALLGYRTPYEKAVLYGMAAGFIVVILWSYFGVTIIDSIVPAMFANWVVLFTMHKYYYINEKSAT